jgi:hypothetical protein
MPATLHIFLSHDPTDAAAAADLERQLRLIFQPADLAFWRRENVPSEEYRVKAGQFLEKTDLFVALLSMNYEDKPDVRWEADTARPIQARRPVLQIMTVQVRPAPAPVWTRAYPVALPPGETVEQHAVARDRQLARVAQMAKTIVEAAPKKGEKYVFSVDLPLILDDVKERLLTQTDRLDTAPVLRLLLEMVADVRTKRTILDLEDAFGVLLEKTRLSKIDLHDLQAQSAPLRLDLQHLIQNLPDSALTPNWKSVFIRKYFHFGRPPRETDALPPFFIPADEIAIPETLNLTVGPREQESLEQIGLLSYEQKTDFRRSLLLCKDALAVGNPAKAFTHCEHARNKIDPQSAQLYEYLLITHIQRESAARILEDAVNRNGKLLNFIELYATRLIEYQREDKCPSSTALYNLEIASEALSDAALRFYHRLPNDYILNTGKHAEDAPDNRAVLQRVLQTALTVNRVVCPYEEFLEAAIAEFCGGGKYDWIEKVEVAGEDFHFIPKGHFDPEGEVAALLDTLDRMAAGSADKLVKQRPTLREDVYYSLMTKRQTLRRQIAEDERLRRPFTDIRASIIRFVYACTFNAQLFGDEDEDRRGQSFHRMAMEYLLPQLTPAAEIGSDLYPPWFVLDERGELRNHPDCAAYGFDTQGIVEKIIRDQAGRGGWLQVAPNLKQEVFLQYSEIPDRQYEKVRVGLQWIDFRRMDTLEARRLLIDCLRRWTICYRAYPERGQEYVDRCIRELGGDGLMLWLQHDPETLVSHPDSTAFGYDAAAELRALLAHSTRFTEHDLRRPIAQNLFDKRILTAYQAIKPGDAAQLPLLVRLFSEAFSGYRLHPDPRYLDFVWRELTEELKFRWIDVDVAGKWAAAHQTAGFHPIRTLERIAAELGPVDREVYGIRQARMAVASRRYAEQLELYFREISEYKHENRLPERGIAIDIIQRMKGIFRFFPNEQFLELPLRELSGKGRIRWNALFLGIFPSPENHYENHQFNFDYKYALYDLKNNLLGRHYELMQEMLREVGEL